MLNIDKVKTELGSIYDHLNRCNTEELEDTKTALINDIEVLKTLNVYPHIIQKRQTELEYINYLLS